MPERDSDLSAISWYHAIELPDGRVTPGMYDLRGALRSIPFPASLEGMRCLDVGTADGFWAFEMERRGAAEVVAVDVVDASRRDFPWMPGERQVVLSRSMAFSTAHRLIGSSIQHRDLSAYELDPAALGQFDFVFIGDLLLHLRDPVRALAGAASVLRPSGELLLNEAISLKLTILHPSDSVVKLEATPRPRWWLPNAQALRRMVVAAGLEIVETGKPYGVRPLRRRRDVPKAVRPRQTYRSLRVELRLRTYGVPHVWLRARPAK